MMNAIYQPFLISRKCNWKRRGISLFIKLNLKSTVNDKNLRTAPQCRVVDRRFPTQTRPTLGVLFNLGQCAAFAMTSVNG